MNQQQWNGKPHSRPKRKLRGGEIALLGVSVLLLAAGIIGLAAVFRDNRAAEETNREQRAVYYAEPEKAEDNVSDVSAGPADEETVQGLKASEEAVPVQEPETAAEEAPAYPADGNLKTTVTEQAEPAYEPWISVRYDLKDPSEDFLAYFMEQTTYPDCFVVRVEDTPYGNLYVAYGAAEDLPAGGVAVTVTVDGQTLPGDDCRLETETFAYEGTTFYTYLLIVPRPESLPAEGKAQVIVTRRLLSYPDIVRTDVKEVSFGGEG